jgi:uncharacterized Zn finger protein
MRRLRGLEIVARGDQVSVVDGSRYLVRSQKRNGAYTVECKNGEWTCECPDYDKRGKACKHVFAVAFLRTLPHILSINRVTIGMSDPQSSTNRRNRIARNGV